MYTDEVRARVEAAVQKKVEGQEITTVDVPESSGAQVIDLMEALRASLNKKTPAPSKASAPEAPAREDAQAGPPRRRRDSDLVAWHNPSLARRFFLIFFSRKAAEKHRLYGH